MPNIMMPNIVSQITPGKGVDPKAQVPAGKEGSFVQHLQNQIKADRACRDNVMGKVCQLKKNMPGKVEEESEPPASVEALLQQVMNYLQKTLEQPKSDAGEWSFQLQDIGILEQLAGQAGMDLSTLNVLKKQMEQQGGLPLADLFAALERNFKELGEATKVTASETYLPLLDSFLARLGVSPEAIKQIDGQGVNGVDQLDLVAYLQGVKGISLSQIQGPQVQGQDGSSSFVLSDWEREQMTAMLTEAGVPSAVIDTMFPEVKTLEEKALAGFRDDQGDTQVSMTLDRLQSLLQRAIAATDEASPKANLSGFLEGLQLVLSQAGFQEEGVGWSPVVQGTMQAVYEQLQAMVHVATVKGEKLSDERELGSSVLPQGEGGEQAEAMFENKVPGQPSFTAADGASPKANLIDILEGLQAVLSQVGSQEVGGGKTPVIQGSQQAVYAQLQAMIHLATVKLEKLSGEQGIGSPVLSQVAGVQPLGDGKPAAATIENEVLGQQGLTGVADSSTAVAGALSGDGNEALADSMAEVGANPQPRAGEGHVQPAIEVRSVDPGVDHSAKLQASRMRLTPELQQFAVEQISHGVLRGLRNNDQHLALTLYPKELGEVKVDLQVRGSHLSVTFVMENQKVKAAMEANMGEFKENLERRGFTLGEMSVSIDQHHRSPDEGRQFARTWAEMVENQAQAKKNQALPAVLAEMSQAGQSHNPHGGISLFV